MNILDQDSVLYKPRLRHDSGLNKSCLNRNSLGFWDSANCASELWKLSKKRGKCPWDYVLVEHTLVKVCLSVETFNYTQHSRQYS